MKPRALDLFSGAAGGWSLGLHRAGFETIAACEIDPWRREQFAENFPGVKLYDDVRTITAARLRADGVVPDIIVGSPPCQDASAANHKGKGVDGARTGLFFEALRLVREVRPRWCAFENSPRLRTRGLDRLLGELEAADYAAWPLVVAASDLGANHIRSRLILVAADRRQMPHADGEGQHAGAGDASPVAWRAEPGRHAPDADGARLAIWQGIAGDDGEECPAAERDGACHGHRHWSAGAPDFGRMDDGLSDKVARALISAYGDAFLPQKAELIGRAILAAEAA